MIRVLPAPAPGADLFAEIPDPQGLAPHVGVRHHDEIPPLRAGRRSAQRNEVRSLLTRLLVSLHGSDAGERWPLAQTELGQPYLRGPGAPAVSLAHSGKWLACASVDRGAVGIDLEVVKPRDWEALQDQFLHPFEAEWVMAVRGSERDVRGYACWCRKEACLKALGIGVALPLDTLAFSPEGRLIAAPDGLGASNAWHTETWHFDSSAVLAVAWTD